MGVDFVSNGMFAGMKIAIIHDWLVAYAGADRVVDQIHAIFPQAVIYTLVYDPKAFPPHFQKYDVRTSHLQRIPFATKLYKNMLALMPRAFEQMDLSEYDLVISSASCCSKGVIVRPDALHICYCHTPIRYVWGSYHEYLRSAGLLKRLVMPRMIHKVRIWDYLAAQRVDWFIANSNEVAGRIRKYYRRDATVIHPGCRMVAGPTEKAGDYYLMAGRLTHYKRFDLGVQACTRLGKRLIVTGHGEQEKALHAMAGPTVEFRSNVTDAELDELYLHAKALIFPGEEDFGIVPVEAQSAGAPVLAYGRGGALDTVVDGETGLLFQEQTVEALCECLLAFERAGVRCTRDEIRQRAQRFSTDAFRVKFEAYVRQRLEEAQ